MAAGSSRAVNMLEINAHLNLGKNEILQGFSLLAKFTKLNVMQII